MTYTTQLDPDFSPESVYCSACGEPWRDCVCDHTATPPPKPGATTSTQKNPAMFTSKSTEWSTPQALFDTLNAEFHFNLDVCATPENAKCPQYFTKEVNGLVQDWAGSRFWMNPPYGRGVFEWVSKAFQTGVNGGFGVALLPSRTDVRWWWEFVEPIRSGAIAGEVRFVRGRLKFGAGKNTAPFPSVIIVFGVP